VMAIILCLTWPVCPCRGLQVQHAAVQQLARHDQMARQQHPGVPPSPAARQGSVPAPRQPSQAHRSASGPLLDLYQRVPGAAVPQVQQQQQQQRPPLNGHYSHPQRGHAVAPVHGPPASSRPPAPVGPNAQQPAGTRAQQPPAFGAAPPAPAAHKPQDFLMSSAPSAKLPSMASANRRLVAADEALAVAIARQELKDAGLQSQDMRPSKARTWCSADLYMSACGPWTHTHTCPPTLAHRPPVPRPCVRAG
jgi:hypothetical protein